ncbi:MAG: LruC domain-containing protein [Bacteroidales bacterium]
MKKNRRRFVSLLGLTCAALTLVLFSCDKSSSVNPVPDTPDETPTYFEFNTVKDYTLTVNLNQGTGLMGLLRFDIYDQNPFKLIDGEEQFNTDLYPIFKGITDNKGKFSGKMRIPTAVTNLYMRVKSLGFPDFIMANVVGDVITFDVTAETKAATKGAYSTVSVTNGYALAPWNINGVPDNIYTTDVVSPGLLLDISTSLPEGIDLRISHPEFIQPTLEYNLVLNEKAVVDIAFVHEGAGFTNALGYYTYPTNNPPSSMTGVRKNIVFPNVSFLNSGGGLLKGNRVHLKYWNGSAYQDSFPAGTTVAWFLVANGFNTTTKAVGNGLYTSYSDAEFNIESNASLKQHVVLLHDDIRNLMVLAFEDKRRDIASCDQDFNDAIFYVIPTPFSAAETINLADIDRAENGDIDGDGVLDESDEFPNDPTLAYALHYPGNNLYGSLAFEDLWPAQGDNDMNDMVCDYNIIHYMSAQNLLVRIGGTIRVRASGAKYLNGFAMELGVSPAAVQSLSVTGGSVTNLTLDGKGLETGQSKANIIFFDDVYKLFGAPPGSFINTDMSNPVRNYKTITFNLRFVTPQIVTSVTTPPYNPYIIIQSGSGERTKEVHLAGYHPTDKADPAFFSTGQDLTNVGLGRYYVASNNMPFAIHLPEMFYYPIEKQIISGAYTKFSPWASSLGVQYSNWYMNNAGYRNSNMIFSK